jgi:hypothetical protein
LRGAEPNQNENNLAGFLRIEMLAYCAGTRKTLRLKLVELEIRNHTAALGRVAVLCNFVF